MSSNQISGLLPKVHFALGTLHWGYCDNQLEKLHNMYVAVVRFPLLCFMPSMQFEVGFMPSIWSGVYVNARKESKLQSDINFPSISVHVDHKCSWSVIISRHTIVAVVNFLSQVLCGEVCNITVYIGTPGKGGSNVSCELINAKSRLFSCPLHHNLIELVL